MDYILRGNDKDVANVLKEQRIRIGRGVVSFTPISECGLVTEEDARKTLECMLTEKDAKIGELTESITEKDKAIVELTGSKCLAPVPAGWQRHQPPARPGYAECNRRP